MRFRLYLRAFFPVDAARMNAFWGGGGRGYVANTSLTLKL